jgi:uncharacterized protein YjdB
MGQSFVDSPFVVFSQPSIVIDRLEVPVRAPVAVGSTASTTTMQTNDATVVTGTPSGELLAHRNGHARIRAARGEGSALEVEVRALRSLLVEPPTLVLVPGGEARITVLGDGTELSQDEVRWTISDPSAVSIRGGLVRAAATPGMHTITARNGALYATVHVSVEAPTNWSVSVRPARLRMKKGQVSTFQAFLPSGSVSARWESSRPGILAVLDGGLVQAVAVGDAKVCAVSAGRKGCSEVEVTP